MVAIIKDCRKTYIDNVSLCLKLFLQKVETPLSSWVYPQIMCKKKVELQLPYSICISRKKTSPINVFLILVHFFFGMKIEENKYNNTHQIQNRGKTHNNLSLAPTLSSSPHGHGIQLGYTTGIVYSVHIRQWYFNSTHKVHRTCQDLQYNMDKKQVSNYCSLLFHFKKNYALFVIYPFFNHLDPYCGHYS